MLRRLFSPFPVSDGFYTHYLGGLDSSFAFILLLYVTESKPSRGSSSLWSLVDLNPPQTILIRLLDRRGNRKGLASIPTGSSGGGIRIVVTRPISRAASIPNRLASLNHN